MQQAISSMLLAVPGFAYATGYYAGRKAAAAAGELELAEYDKGTG